MAQFFVYKNTARNKKIYPYFIDIQSDFLNHLSTHLVIPLARKQSANSQVKVY
ncbi:CcdB family protein [Yersinia enterocolitica]|uniref:CcdB family protein n=1 Tax=Yersinia enterocolitica TaxID=630 RepID=UPI00398CDAD6